MSRKNSNYYKQLRREYRDLKKEIIEKYNKDILTNEECLEEEIVQNFFKKIKKVINNKSFKKHSKYNKHKK